MLTLMIVVLANSDISLPNLVKAETVMAASVYGKEMGPKAKMANGEKFKPEDPVVAHRSLPLGTLVLLINGASGKWIVATVKDRGPYVRGRHLDLSSGVAARLDVRPGHNGTAPVKVLVLKRK